jgi:hypothetical protein
MPITLIDPETIHGEKILCIFQPVRVHPHWETLIAGAPIHALNYPSLSLLKKILLWKSSLIYARAYPRGLDYAVNMLHELVTQMDSTPELDLLQVYTTAVPISETARGFFKNLWDVHDQAALTNYDAAIFLYADPIGLGWNKTERAVERLGNLDLYVLNGRRRLFKWDASTRERLNWRRFLELSWIAETSLAVLTTLAAIPLMIYDLVKGSK